MSENKANFLDFMKKYSEEVDGELVNFFPKNSGKDWAQKAVGESEFGFDGAAFQSSIVVPVWDFLERGGKRIRPALMLLACEAVGGKK
ncbi:MAG: hypothetical protein NUV67_00045, partial [archaeon]|nr:hypothetical protein [archaeon]